MNKVRWVIDTPYTYLEVFEKGKWIHYRNSKHYEPEQLNIASKGFRTMQNCLKAGYEMIEPYRKVVD